MLKHPTLDKLQALKFTGMVAALNDQMAMQDIEDLAFEERLGLLVDREITERENRRLTSRLRRAKLRHNAALEDIDYQNPRGLDKGLIQSLAACQWSKNHLNILITGPTGVGKTWLIPPEQAPNLPPGVCMKMIPSSEEGKPFEVLQYVEDATELVPAVDASGRMEIYKGVGSVMMPNETDVWPIYKLKPIRMVDAYLIRGDMDFGHGKILKDFNA